MLRKTLSIVLITSTAFAGTAMSTTDNLDFKPTTLSPTAEPIHPGRFEPTWESLGHYQVPDWFRDAKFGIWAHWGPQCQPEQNDWYARHMYVPEHWQYKAHIAKYGHPSKFGFKDVIHEWKAEKFLQLEQLFPYTDPAAKIQYGIPFGSAASTDARCSGVTSGWPAIRASRAIPWRTSWAFSV